MTASQDKEAEPSNVLSEPILSSDDIDDKDYRYRDFSHVKEDDDNPDLQEDHTPVQSSPRGNSESSIRVQKFPVKLYVILAQKEFNDIVTWMPHGRSWKVLKPSLFESMVMPLFFEYSNYHSFNRLVNAWSFRRIGAGPDRGAYYHEVSASDGCCTMASYLLSRLSPTLLTRSHLHVWLTCAALLERPSAPSEIYATTTQDSQEVTHG